jgi:hypothetical protein
MAISIRPLVGACPLPMPGYGVWQPMGTLKPPGPVFPRILFIQNPLPECLSHDQVTHASGSTND